MRCTTILGLLFAAGATAMPNALSLDPPTTSPDGIVMDNANVNAKGCGWWQGTTGRFLLIFDDKCYEYREGDILEYHILDGCSCHFYIGSTGAGGCKSGHVLTKVGPLDGKLPKIVNVPGTFKRVYCNNE